MAKPKYTRNANAAEIDHILERMEQAVLANESDTLMAATAELWEYRDEAAAVMGQRISDDRAAIPELWLEMIESFSGPGATPIYRRIATDAVVSDVQRLEARRHVGWPTRGAKKRRSEFLATLRAPEAALAGTVVNSMRSWPPRIEPLEEVLDYLAAVPAEQRRAAVRQIIGAAGQAATWILHGVLHIRDAEVQRMALDQLLAWRHSASTGPVRRLAATARSHTMRDEAATVAARLEMRIVGVDTAESGSIPLPPIDRAYLSQIDGDGGQIVALTRQIAPEMNQFIDVFHNEASGIKSLICRQQAPDDQIEEAIEGLEAGEIEMVKVDPAAARGALVLAAERNGVVGKPMPPAFELWEPFVHERYPATPDEPLIPPILDDEPYADRADLVADCGELFTHSWFATWLVPYDDMIAAMEEVPPPDGQMTNRQYRPLIKRFFTPEFRATLRRRLRCQAWLLEQEEEPRDRDRALAVAASLAAIEPAALLQHPFVREMTRVSVENALSALYWEAFE